MTIDVIEPYRNTIRRMARIIEELRAERDELREKVERLQQHLDDHIEVNTNVEMTPNERDALNRYLGRS